MTVREHRLPPGQSADDLRRFGLPAFAARRPMLPAEPRLVLVGEHGPHEVPVAELLTDHRETLVSDLHCVTTWSAVDLRWSGVAFRIVHEWILGRFELPSSARWVRFRGLDGFHCCLRIDDAVAADVLLADRLDGQPLTPDHGAPLRLVAPAHYGYKSVKHVASIDYLAGYRPGPAGWMAHPRGRVASEERSRFLPGRLWRPVWRAAVPMVRRRYAEAR